MESKEEIEIDVSFIVIALNEEANIGLCVKSILDQDSELSIEVILVDDGSTDETVNTARTAAAGDARLQIIALETNRGRGKARARGLAEARGRDIAFVDADIQLPSGWLNRCMRDLKAYVAVSGIAVPDGDIAPIVRITKATPIPTEGSMPITGNNVLFQGTVIRHFGFPENKQGEDFRLAARIMEAGLSIASIPSLRVSHLERKSFSKYLKWMFVSGKDATQLLIENLIVRKADIAWGLWFTTIGALLTGIFTWDAVVVEVSLGLNLLAVLGITFLHCLNRFEFRKSKTWLAAYALSVPAIFCYLIGRTAGLVKRHN